MLWSRKKKPSWGQTKCQASFKESQQKNKKQDNIQPLRQEKGSNLSTLKSAFQTGGKMFVPMEDFIPSRLATTHRNNQVIGGSEMLGASSPALQGLLNVLMIVY